MKDTFRCVGLFLTGLVAAVILYPFLHEAGHAVTAVLAGAKGIRINLFPMPYVICEVSNLNTIKLILIGLSGLFVPTAISIIVKPKTFWLWYCNLAMRIICLLSFVISFVAIVLHFFGVTIKNEDIVQVIDVWNNGRGVLGITMMLFIVVIIRSIVKQKPIIRIMSYFNMTI